MKNEVGIKILHGAEFLLYLCIIEPGFCSFRPSFQAALCLFLARKFLSKKPNVKSWSSFLTYNTNYTENEIKNNLRIPLIVIKNYFNNVYTKDFCNIPFYKKYKSTKYSGISDEFTKLFKARDNKFLGNNVKKKSFQNDNEV